MVKVDNAIIMAAGTSSRFAPISFEMPKGLINVKGEVLIERQIRQLHEAGIDEVIIVTGYKHEMFEYLKDKFNVKLIHNPNYLTRNNNGSLYVARDFLKNTYVCSADNYFTSNPFNNEETDSYYAAVYANGNTNEWCLHEDENGYIDEVTVGGNNAWYMLGHTFWNDKFSQEFKRILLDIYEEKETENKLWEAIFMDHLDVLKMKVKKFEEDFIFEFDTLDELRMFDQTYVNHTNSPILERIAKKNNCSEGDIVNLVATKGKDNSANGFKFLLKGKEYQYFYADGNYEEVI